MLCVRLPAQRSDTAFALWGIVGAGALLSKFQTVYFIGPMILLLVWRLVRAEESFRLAWRRILCVAAIILATVVVVTAPHFVKNTVFHHNPVYPLAQDWFTGSRPTVPDAPLLVRYFLTDWNCKPMGDVWHRFASGSRADLYFRVQAALRVHGESADIRLSLHADAAAVAVCDRRRRRLWVGAIVSLMALFCWASTYLVDRNLQIILPLLVATTAAILVRAWAVGWLARLGVVALLALQIVWGGDLWFAGSDRMMNSISLIAAALTGVARVGFAECPPTISLWIVLCRRMQSCCCTTGTRSWNQSANLLGLAGFQGVVDYREFKNARDFYDRLRTLGVTHVVYLPGEQAACSNRKTLFS